MTMVSKRSTLATSCLMLGACAWMAGCGAGDSQDLQQDDVGQLVRAVDGCGSDQAMFKHLSDSSGWTNVSGDAHSYLEHVAPSRKGIFYLSLEEKADDPVELYVGTDYLGANLSSYAPWNQNDDGRLQLNDGNLSSQKDVDVGAGAYITKIQVCTTNKADPLDNEIKGIRIWGATLNRDGSLNEYSWSSSFERPNCATWRNKVGCPSGKVATGIRAHYLYATTGFSGLAIRCSTPEPYEPAWCDLE